MEFEAAPYGHVYSRFTLGRYGDARKKHNLKVLHR